MLSRLKFEIQGLFEEIYNKRLPDSVFTTDGVTFADIQSAGLQSIIPIVNKFRENGRSDDYIRSHVYAFMENEVYLNYVMVKFPDLPVTFDIYKESIDMKFDVIVGNPPFTKDAGGGNTISLWDKLVEKSFSLCKDNGYVSLIHPNGWRNIKGNYKKIQKLLLDKKIEYIELHSTEDGQKTFGVTTPYDLYVIKNIEDNNSSTIVKDYDGVISTQNLNNLEFIPNANFELIYSLIAGENEPTVDVIEDSSYHHQRDYMSPTQTEVNQYPCVYSIYKDETPSFKYSSVNNKGHFNISKLILGNGANPTSLIDENGEYGMTQFTFGIVDTIENLRIIKEVLESERFKKITKSTKYVATAGNPLVYPKILKTFRKDFWKEFIDE